MRRWAAEQACHCATVSRNQMNARFSEYTATATCKSGADPGSCIIKPCTGAHKAFKADVVWLGAAHLRRFWLTSRTLRLPPDARAVGKPPCKAQLCQCPRVCLQPPLTCASAG